LKKDLTESELLGKRLKRLIERSLSFKFAGLFFLVASIIAIPVFVIVFDNMQVMISYVIFAFLFTSYGIGCLFRF